MENEMVHDIVIVGHLFTSSLKAEEKVLLFVVLIARLVTFCNNFATFLLIIFFLDPHQRLV